MKFIMVGTACAICMSIGVIAPNTASAITYEISWIGSNGYTLGGLFSYDDSLTGLIDETELNTFMIEGFHDGVSLGSWDMVDGIVNPNDPLNVFNFNFDSKTQQFLVGGGSKQPTGQSWNMLANGLGFVSGDHHQVLSLDGVFLFPDSSEIPTGASTLTATFVPVPAAVYLFASGLLGLFGISRRESHKRYL